jgi:hypothetical protein
MQAIRETPLYRRQVEKGTFPVLDRIEARTGLDVRKDWDEFLIASDGKDALAMVRGRFSKSELEAKLAQNGATKSIQSGTAVFSGNDAAVAFPSSTIALAGTVPAVTAALAANTGLPDALSERLAEVPRMAHLWAVTAGGLPPFPVVEGTNLGNLARIYNSIESAIFWADLREGLALHMKARCSDEEMAGQVHTALRGFVGVGRLSAGKGREDLVRLYDSIVVNKDKDKVILSAEMPLSVAEELFTFLQKSAKASASEGESRRPDSSSRRPR